MEKLEKVAMDHIKNPMMDGVENQKALKAFLKYCKVGCGWFPYSKVDSEQAETCLENFKKEYPEHAECFS